MRLAFWGLRIGLLAALAARGIAGPEEPRGGDPALDRAREIFRQQVRPMLQGKCLSCHGDGEELEGDLDLRSREAVLRGGKSGPAMVPGRALASLIYQSLRRIDEKRMPPKERERVTPDEIDALKNWIEAGAPWDPGEL
jgi:mono/diheme cytochrome c family protein